MNALQNVTVLVWLLFIHSELSLYLNNTRRCFG